MNGYQAYALLREYCELLHGQARLAALQPILEDARGMSQRFPTDGSNVKAMRWLGYMQDVLVASGVFTLAQVKEHAKTGRVT